MDSYFLNNKHVKYLIEKMDIVLVGISNSIENLENFFNIAVDKIEDFNVAKKIAPITITKTGYNLNFKFLNNDRQHTQLYVDIRLIDSNDKSDKFIRLSNSISTTDTYVSQSAYNMEIYIRNCNDTTPDMVIYEQINGEYVEVSSTIERPDQTSMLVLKSYPANNKIPNLKIMVPYDTDA